MDWYQIKVSCSHADLDEVCAVMSMLDNSLQIEDYSDIDEVLKPLYGELIDDSILKADPERCSVSIYVPEEKNYPEYLAWLRDRFRTLKIDAALEVTGVREEDWYNEWKKGYRPVHIGDRLTVVPAWMDYVPSPDEIIVRMDPGMAFGTGTHETTRLCAAMIEKHLQKGSRVLDVGTGSGILSFFALKLGAGCVNAYDIDPVAVRIAKENAAANGVTGFTCGVSDLLKDADLSGGQYDLVVSNIVADILIRMAQDADRYVKPGGKLICSGIIEDRSGDVRTAFESKGFELADSGAENDWKVLVLRKPGE